ncbi:unnamed protein product [Prorocentrum cordatum]|uniref:Uncharacterized protein n=1 Tax=Prorocentrum cordatum TaxID=2364126 RepID=A0ABN9S0W2_9DINO|nr:unnamed protein product [Polarella glacialis]
MVEEGEDREGSGGPPHSAEAKARGTAAERSEAGHGVRTPGRDGGHPPDGTIRTRVHETPLELIRLSRLPHECRIQSHTGEACASCSIAPPPHPSPAWCNVVAMLTQTSLVPLPESSAA